VLSDGATRLVDRFSLLDWPGFLGILAEQGPEAIIAQVRAAEGSDPDGQRWPRGEVVPVLVEVEVAVPA
jgi:hypothetical protein